MNEQKSRGILDWSLSEGTYRARGGVKIVNLVGDGVAQCLGTRGANLIFELGLWYIRGLLL